MTLSSWQEFSYDSSEIQYPGETLASHWERLHEGDREPFPDADWVNKMDQEHGVLEDREAGDVAEALQEAWRAYHSGEFERAWQLGQKLGVIGSFVGNKAGGIHAVYLEADEKTRMDRFMAIAESSEAAAEAMPGHANSHYFRAFSLGRYSQGISVIKALKQGMGGKIRESLEAALELEPDHADAHCALGVYQAEVIDKVGSLLGGLTYGANTDNAIEHFEVALEAAPNSAITRVEVANGLLMLKGDDAYDRASELYVEAAEMEPWDAMERLDVDLALSELE